MQVAYIVLLGTVVYLSHAADLHHKMVARHSGALVTSRALIAKEILTPYTDVGSYGRSTIFPTQVTVLVAMRVQGIQQITQ